METRNPLIAAVRQDLWRRDKNWICIIHGDAGCGKSGCAIRLASLIDKKFTIDNLKRFVVFTPQDLVRLINWCKRNKVSLRGRTIIFDDAGKGWAAREFFKEANIETSALVQTMRFLNFALILTIPWKSLLDKTGRLMYHADLEPISRTTEHAMVKWKKVKKHWKDEDKKIKYYPWIRNKVTGKLRKITRVRVMKPQENMLRLYKKLKKEHMQTYYQELEDRRDVEEEKRKPKPPNKECLNPECLYKWWYLGIKLRPQCPRCNRRRTQSIEIAE